MSEQDRSRLAKEYSDTKYLLDKVTKQVNELKSVLVKELDTDGTPDDRGHVWCPAGDFTLKKERRVSEVFDSAAATKWAKDNGYWDEVKEVIEVVSEERVLALGWNHPELTDKLTEFYDLKVSWVFKVIEGRSYDGE